MLLTDFFRSFLPMRNPIGFGASDFIELGLAALLLVLALISRPWIEPCSSRFARRTGWCMLVLAVLPVALRLILIPRHPSQRRIYTTNSGICSSAKRCG